MTKKKSALTKVFAIIVSIQLMLAMVPVAAFAEIGADDQGAPAPDSTASDDQNRLIAGITDKISAQEAEGDEEIPEGKVRYPAGRYLVNIDPVGDENCSYFDLQVWLIDENGNPFEGTQVATSSIPALWDARDFEITTSTAPEKIRVQLMWKGPGNAAPVQVSFEKLFECDYLSHPIEAEASGKGLDQPIEVAFGTYYAECVESTGGKLSLSYVDQNEMPKQQHDWEPLREHEGQFTGGWFALRENFDPGQLAFVAGDNNLVLCDGAHLNCPNGILVVGGASLTIWSQRKGTGKITATGQMNHAPQFNPLNPDIGYGDAGIGGYGTDYGTACGDITINGGIIEAKGGPGAAGIGGTDRYKSGAITINRGRVTAIGGENSVRYGSGSAAGIGGGTEGDSGPITINGGIVYAEGNSGIGGGSDGDSGPITITGGEIYACSKGSRGAGIGGGHEGTNKGPITISGGVVKAEVFKDTSSQDGGVCSAAIGAGYKKAQSGAITISNGATVVAKSYGFGAGIGGGADGTKGKSGGTITISGADTQVVAISLHGAGIGSGGDGLGVNAGQGKHNGGTITINDGVVYAQSYGSGAGIGGGNNGSGGTITINNGCVLAYGGQTEHSWKRGDSHNFDMESQAVSLLSGQAEIPSMDSASDPINKYMDNYLYGLIADAVLDLIFSGTYGGAGIGGGDDGSGGKITINGGVVEARAGMNSCRAIGWGDGGSHSVDLSIYDDCKVTYGDLHKSGRNEGLVNGSSLNSVYGAVDGKQKVTEHAYGLIAPVTIVVGFDMGGHGAALENQELLSGEYVQEPVDPEAEGYVFDGWYTDDTYTEHFDFTQPVSASTILYGKWLKTYDVTIKKDWPAGSNPPSSTEIYYVNEWDEGRTIQAPRLLSADSDWSTTIEVTEESILTLTERSVDGFALTGWRLGSGTSQASVAEGAVGADGRATIDLTGNAARQVVTGGNAVVTLSNTRAKTYSVKKEWDIDYYRHYKPASLDVVLQHKEASGTWTTIETIELNDENNWTATFAPITDDAAHVDADYRVRELDAQGNVVLGAGDQGAPENPQVEFEVTPYYDSPAQTVTYEVDYAVDYEAGENYPNTTITNTAQGEVFHVKIAWGPDAENVPKPDSVSVNLEYDAGGDRWARVQTLTVSEETGWEADFAPQLDEGAYRIREIDSTDYRVYQGDETALGPNTAKRDKAMFVVDDNGSTRKYEYNVAYAVEEADENVTIIQNTISGTIYSVAKEWGSGQAHGVSEVYAVLQHREADGTWTTIEAPKEVGSQAEILLMNQAGALCIRGTEQWQADFGAVPYGTPDSDYRVREVVSDHKDYYGDGGVLDEGEGTAYTVYNKTYHVKTILAADDNDNEAHAPAQFRYKTGEGETTYDVSYGWDSGGNFTIANTEHNASIPDDVDEVIGGTVYWVGGDEASRPTEIELHVYAQDFDEKWEVPGSPVTVKASDGWKWSLHLAVGDPAVNADISVQAKALQGYAISFDGLNAIVEPAAAAEPETVDVSGCIIWNDDSDNDGLRPDSVRVKLLANGAEQDFLDVTAASAARTTDTEGVVATDERTWNWAFTGLPATDANGQPIVYTIDEETTDVVTGVNGPGTYGVTVSNALRTITNTHTHESIDVQAEVVWDDNGNQDGSRPDTAILRLVGNHGGGSTQIVSSSTNEAVTFSDMPKYFQGAEIEYRLVEDPIAEYHAQITGNVRNGFRVTNTHAPGKTHVDVSLLWNDADDNDGIRPNSATVQLFANGEYAGKQAVVSADTNWSYSFTDLDIAQNGESIEYSVDIAKDSVLTGSDVPGAYTFAVHNGVYAYNAATGEYQRVNEASDGNNAFTIINTHTPELTDIVGVVLWDDSSNADHRRPSSVRNRLWIDGKASAVKTASPDENGRWLFSFGSYQKYQNGREIAYVITEDALPNYVAQYDGFNVTNHYVPDMTQITVAKAWDDGDDHDGIRPGAILVDVLGDGELAQTLVLHEGNGWVDSTSALPLLRNGEDIDYSVLEQQTAVVSGADAEGSYAIEVVGDEQRGFTVSNKHTPSKSRVTVAQVWDDENGRDGLRPESVVARLMMKKQGDESWQDTGRSIELSDENGWQGSFNGLEYEKDGEQLDYTVVQDETGVIAGVDGEGTYASAIIGSMQDGFVIKSTHTPEMVSVEGSKTWIDEGNQDGVRPESITIRLLANNAEVDSATVTVAEDWAWSFEDLPKYADSVPITYTVSEDVVEGYTATVAENGWDVINTHTPGKTQVNVVKVWNDDNDADGIRPAYVTVRLLADGQDTGEALQLTPDNAWAASFADLDAMKDGEAIAYTVEEQLTDVVTGVDSAGTYASAISGDAVAGFTLTNTHTPAEKQWEQQQQQGAITYMLNGGTYNGSTADIVEVHDVGEIIRVHEAPTREGYTFSYWKGSEYQPGDAYEVTGDHVFVAQWKENASSTKPTNSTDNTSTKASPGKTTPTTGDPLNVAALATLAITAALALLATSIRRRKE